MGIPQKGSKSIFTGSATGELFPWYCKRTYITIVGYQQAWGILVCHLCGIKINLKVWTARLKTDSCTHVFLRGCTSSLFEYLSQPSFSLIRTKPAWCTNALNLNPSHFEKRPMSMCWNIAGHGPLQFITEVMNWI